jgi:hypothetical protein
MHGDRPARGDAGRDLWHWGCGRDVPPQLNNKAGDAPIMSDPRARAVLTRHRNAGHDDA